MSRPEDRYIKLETKTLPDGRVVYKPALPRSVPVDDLNDVVIYAADTDRLDVMANNVYGSPTEWWRIAKANGMVNGSLFLTPGTKIIVPKG
jgi:nucleoid-associated protein YgaU